MARDKVISSWQNSPALVWRSLLRQWCWIDSLAPMFSGTSVKGICTPSSVSPVGVCRVVHAVWSSRKQDFQRLCYCNCILNYLCIMKGAVKQSCIRAWTPPMSSYPGTYAERKNSHALPTIKAKEFGGSLTFCCDPNRGLWIAVQEKSEPIKPARDKDHKNWLFSIVAFYINNNIQWYKC